MNRLWMKIEYYLEHGTGSVKFDRAFDFKPLTILEISLPVTEKTIKNLALPLEWNIERKQREENHRRVCTTSVSTGGPIISMWFFELSKFSLSFKLAYSTNVDSRQNSVQAIVTIVPVGGLDIVRTRSVNWRNNMSIARITVITNGCKIHSFRCVEQVSIFLRIILVST